MRVVYGGALGARARRESGVLLVGAANNLAVRQQHRGAYMEFAVGRIRIFGHSLCLVN